MTQKTITGWAIVDAKGDIAAADFEDSNVPTFCITPIEPSEYSLQFAAARGFLIKKVTITYEIE